MSDEATAELFDAVVIGTGFGGAVAACRLAQAKKKVCILERGRRYGLGDFPRPAERPDKLPHTARWAWAIDHGLWDVKDLQGMLAVQAAGYGGGSLVYANVHLRPPPQVFSPPTRHGLDADGWPACYSRADLSPYYDAVAAVLRVRPLPATPSPASGLSGPLPKAEAMRAAATGLGRAQWFLLPPLAIDFDKCVMCGECVAGCQIHAKNTLDLNYLAAAEREADVDVRTLAEAVEIKEEADGTYTVTYHDHITGSDGAKVRAKSVFLCAGAVNSTHILLRSAAGLPDMPNGSKDHIGRRFFANGDAIAMVFDTTKGPVPKPTLGPTITTTLLYNQGAPHVRAVPGDWFVLQEGGYPKWLEPVLGLFRGEFWLGRNRIERGQGRPASFDADAASALTKQAEEIGRALLGLLDARGAFLSGSSRLMAGLGVGDILPPQIRDRLVPDLKGFVKRLEATEADAVSRDTLDEVGRRVIKSRPWLRWFVGLAKNEAEPHLLASTLEILHRHFLKAPPNTAEPFTVAVLWPLAVKAAQRLFLGTRPNDHAFLMLAVGIDAAPGRLYLDDNKRLLAYWNLPANVPFSTMEERLMHDVADELGGEMRLNPDSTAQQRPVTVHCLGGCAMADDPKDGVTDANGKVWGTRALYVLDGAAMPSSLGTNPSATIAAISERNVRMALADPASPIYTPTPIPLDPRLPWQTKEMLDPIDGIPPTPSAPRSPALGLRFDEVMQGFCSAWSYDNLPIRAELRATIDDLNAFLVNPRRPVTISGTVWLTPAPGQPEVAYDAKGTLDLLKQVEAPVALQALFDEGLKLFGALPASASASVAMESLLQRLEKQVHRYEMDYVLDLTRPGAQTLSYRFKGVKRIYGGPGLAPWTETTTLKVTLCDGAGTHVGEGTMHVHLADFLRKQLPSFWITGTEDDVRIAWAFARFFRFFLGTLGQVYLPRLEMLDPFRDRGA